MQWLIEKYKPGKKRICVEIDVPADKSITHRSIMLAALASGQTIVKNYLPAEDCISTANAFRAMGVDIKEEIGVDGSKVMRINGVGLRGLKKPDSAIDAGNSGTTTRLISGILAAQNFESTIVGDDSLSSRPMKRVMDPLTLMGARLEARNGNYLPMKIVGNTALNAIEYISKISSAQVKSCVLLASLFANGKTRYYEPQLSRDHTERMFKNIGINVKEGKDEKGFYAEVTGPINSIASPGEFIVPADISSAAFFIVLGLVVEGLTIKIKRVGMNPTRTGILDVLTQMGVNVKIENTFNTADGPCGDIIVSKAELKPFNIGADLIPRLVDEIPILALLATQANGRSVIAGATELRHKESDRLKAVSSQLIKMGADITETEDGLIINGPVTLKAAEVDSFRDHRIAMMLSVAALAAEGITRIAKAECVSISFPDFINKLSLTGAEIKTYD